MPFIGGVLRLHALQLVEKREMAYALQGRRVSVHNYMGKRRGILGRRGLMAPRLYISAFWRTLFNFDTAARNGVAMSSEEHLRHTCLVAKRARLVSQQRRFQRCPQVSLKKELYAYNA
eukprot:1183395-Prorocentrum_minimum.AAC.2